MHRLLKNLILSTIAPLCIIGMYSSLCEVPACGLCECIRFAIEMKLIHLPMKAVTIAKGKNID
jgi:type III secretory pathway component EscU